MPTPDRIDPADRPPPRAIAADPDARRRIGRASAELLAVLLAAVGAFSALVLWHLSRRARLIRGRLGSPRPADWPEDDHGDGPGDDDRIETHP